MAIKLKKEVINISDELNRELESFGFSITLDDDKKEDTKDNKKDKKTTKKK